MDKKKRKRDRMPEPTLSMSQLANTKASGVNRRDFLKGITVAGSSLAVWSFLGRPDKAWAEGISGSPDRFGMLTDITRCIGCRRCEEACNKAHNLPAPRVPFEDKWVFEQKRRTDAETYTVVNRYANPKTGEPVYRKVQCNHCAEPACASACLVGALKKSPEGPVVYDEGVCVGCRYCMTACPFYIPAFEYSDAGSPAIRKCMMCHDRISKGEIPACAEECPMEAITLGKRSALIRLARDRIRSSPDKYIDHIYGEHEAGGTDWLQISPVPFKDLDFPTNLGVTPYPELTRDFLSTVPLVLIAGPALLGGFYLFSKRRERIDEIGATNQEKEDVQ